MPGKIDKLSNTLGRLLKARGLEGRLSEYRVIGQWEKTVGEGLARHAQPQALRGRKLSIVVDSPAWMQQLSMLKPVIIEKLNGILGKDAIRDVTLKLGEVRTAAKHEAGALLSGALDAGERVRVESYLSGITDSETKEALRHVIEKDLLVKKGKDAGEGTKK